jgi:rhodanese-related sulfurtransferase
MNKENANRKLFEKALWQAAGILLFSVAMGFASNELRRAGLPLWTDSSTDAPPAAAVERELNISLAEAEGLYFSGAAVFLDARFPEDYAAGHIAGAFNVPPDRVREGLFELPAQMSPETPVVTYCDGTGCGLGEELALSLLEQGYYNVRALENGWTRWRQRGLPIQGGDVAFHQEK